MGLLWSPPSADPDPPARAPAPALEPGQDDLPHEEIWHREFNN